ncbi:hexokinase-like [Condylostylus longicornis]|uniref:hexokinase-like n=1 Tax=Condylostylus longicornis TaxID=2530218 RepID=UPI00244DE1C6|nr:hexokinase-like [Condylostylus longicornis]
MLDACVGQLPSGTETGVFYAVDFGGTNFRVVRVELKGDGRLDVRQRQQSLLSAFSSEDCPKGLLDGGATALQMFDFFAQTVKDFMQEEGDHTLSNVQCGFTFSFPCAQRQIDSAVLMTWTKGFETGRRTDDPVEGLDVAELMNVAFKRNGVPVQCNAVLNDTLDFKAIDNRGFQQIEKMCSGAYLGEICRMTLLKIFQNKSPALAWETGSLSTVNIAKIMNDRSKELIVTREIIRDVWSAELSVAELGVIHRIATAVMDRSARLAAVLISGCARKTGRLQAAFGGLSVGIDGSLYKRNPWYRERLRYHLDQMLGPSRSSLIHLLLADDGSGKGAAILSSVIAEKSQ